MARPKKDRHEFDDASYLRALADVIMGIPVMHGTDQCDCDKLHEIANRMSKRDAAIDLEYRAGM